MRNKLWQIKSAEGFAELKFYGFQEVLFNFLDSGDTLGVEEKKERRDVSFHATLQFVSSSVILSLAWEEVNFKNSSHWTHTLHIRRQDVRRST